MRVLGLPNKSNPEKLTYVDTTLFFTATDPGRGRELWKVQLPDEDGDGLLDKWETFGVDYDLDGTPELNLQALGANPRHKDLFVEFDFMKAANPNHTHDPRRLPNDTIVFNNPLERVTARFAEAPASKVKNPDGSPGINLHLEPDEEIAEVTMISFKGRGPATFQGLKERFFGSSSK